MADAIRGSSAEISSETPPGAGRLVYVMGPSGAGKDSLIGYARQRLVGSPNLVFVHRYITRPADAGGENHVALSELEFESRLRQRCFGLHWSSHGHRYGIGAEIDLWLARGLHIVVNGSRAHLDEAARRYPTLLPLLITIKPEALRARLQRRGRETAAEIERRVARATEVACTHPRLVAISNDGDLAVAGEALVALLKDL
ncbi:phosphonate metabolism protein/1,5-bisphosphokinase (PRPP-forming) PhnN [Virgifigura deserti]|uniref:phosphonate metabolism protein/1,5-bisphosphokinase (PRPP-forming) PhnN n=1 Tax=Virgifigura deserti TaxID=2268457 RepID=UPI003CCBA163